MATGRRAVYACRFFVQTNFIAYHGNKFTVRRLTAQVVDRVAKVAVQRVHVAAVPGDLDGVADRALDAAGRGHVALGDFRDKAAWSRR